jgi:hypothetical protein
LQSIKALLPQGLLLAYFVEKLLGNTAAEQS